MSKARALLRMFVSGVVLLCDGVLALCQALANIIEALYQPEEDEDGVHPRISQGHSYSPPALPFSAAVFCESLKRRARDYSADAVQPPGLQSPVITDTESFLKDARALAGDGENVCDDFRRAVNACCPARSDPDQSGIHHVPSFLRRR